jgi:hypothetical protein
MALIPSHAAVASWMSMATTEAPSAARRRTHAAPMSAAAPVTSAT